MKSRSPVATQVLTREESRRRTRTKTSCSGSQHSAELSRAHQRAAWFVQISRRRRSPTLSHRRDRQKFVEIQNGTEPGTKWRRSCADKHKVLSIVKRAVELLVGTKAHQYHAICGLMTEIARISRDPALPGMPCASARPRVSSMAAISRIILLAVWSIEHDYWTRMSVTTPSGRHAILSIASQGVALNPT